MRAALYIRVSTDEQAKEGFSIEAQKRRLISYADSQDWRVVEIYIDDGYSAKDLKRPAMKQLLSDLLENKFDIVLVYKLDRLTRSTADCDYLLKLFESHKVVFQSSTESFETRTATGRLFIRLIADLAQWERENIAERVRFGMEQKALEGKRPGGKLPYGYDKEGNLVPEEAAIIRRLRYLYMVERLSFKKIAVTLIQEGIQRRGYDWTQSSVALTLENPFYAGIIRFGSKLPNGKYPQRKREERVDCIEEKGTQEAIWTEDEFKEHVAFMRSRSDGGYTRTTDYWFTGLLRCGRCGSAMYGRMTTKRSRKDGSFIRSPYYWCSRRKANDTCRMPMFRQFHVEHLLFSHIETIRVNRQMHIIKSEKFKHDQYKQEKEIQKLKRELDTILTRAKKWQYMFVEGLISSETMRDRLNEENQKESQVKARLEELTQLRRETNEVQVQLLELADLWPMMTDLEKHDMLHTIFQEITLFTELENVKGVKNKFFKAEIQPKYK